MPQLLAEFPGFRPRWEKHLAFWDGEPAGNYIDIGEFVYFVVEDLYPSGKSEEVQRAFDLMENWRMNGHVNVQELVVIGFLEDLQNLASQQPFGKEAFIPFLSPKSREGWDDLERFWEGICALIRNLEEFSRMRDLDRRRKPYCIISLKSYSGFAASPAICEQHGIWRLRAS